MTIKEMRRSLGLTQEEMVQELKPVCPGLDVSLLSKIENGICEPNREVIEYAEKQFANSFKAGLDEDKAIMPRELLMLLKQPFYRSLYTALQKGSREKPVTKREICKITGHSDRRVRGGVANLRNAGLPVMSLSTHCGYWLAKHESEERELINEYRHRAYELLRTASALQHSSIGQMEIEFDSPQ